MAISSAAPDEWQIYDENKPGWPGYFEFDWISARYPDLYHKFALSTHGAMREIEKLVDLTGLTVADIGAGTGRSAIRAAGRAEQVIAIDLYESVVAYGKKIVEAAGLTNVAYAVGDADMLPFEDSCIDAVISVWSRLNTAEAYRILKSGGHLIFFAIHPVPCAAN